MKTDYLKALQDAIRHTHGCASTHVGTIPVREDFGGYVVWDGEVEVFDLDQHPAADQCYAWGYQDDAGELQCVAVLRVSPVESPVTAIRAYILAQQEGRKDT